MRVATIGAGQQLRITLAHGYYPSTPAGFQFEHTDLANLIDCLAVLDPRRAYSDQTFVALQLGVELDTSDAGVSLAAVAPPPAFEGAFTRCPRGGLCIHERTCPGSLPGSGTR